MTMFLFIFGHVLQPALELLVDDCGGSWRRRGSPFCPNWRASPGLRCPQTLPRSCITAVTNSTVVPGGSRRRQQVVDLLVVHPHDLHRHLELVDVLLLRHPAVDELSRAVDQPAVAVRALHALPSVRADAEERGTSAREPSMASSRPALSEIVLDLHCAHQQLRRHQVNWKQPKSVTSRQFKLRPIMLQYKGHQGQIARCTSAMAGRPACRVARGAGNGIFLPLIRAVNLAGGCGAPGLRTHVQQQLECDLQLLQVLAGLELRGHEHVHRLLDLQLRVLVLGVRLVVVQQQLQLLDVAVLHAVHQLRRCGGAHGEPRAAGLDWQCAPKVAYCEETPKPAYFLRA
ncbi:hypothetical protein PHYSODRAFT_307863 [Phytophthora sojae]|uniref:Secreted protein n=1 Tax=Phytophthora sojae (strain P6497) TaxID=1094619 RepID=G5AGJ7_PHYSP|nr:hypothetical protein PHYSODRAFT_307863 [Phytophthora sojae]EGZ05277.1 hypothetical protein PHYSODRAFT_307863 [Phytophthora sojae]|eukprot:XP_009539198.1 hypothetical protein PHYSODRAFT_307863 [Phytophthora sojae]